MRAVAGSTPKTAVASGGGNFFNHMPDGIGVYTGDLVNHAACYRLTN